MTRSARFLRRDGRLLICALLLALPQLVLTWGFTVDDALIAARVAHQWVRGFGYAFNPGGGVVDAVTPLGWAACLAPFAGSSPWHALMAARWIGVVGWALAVCIVFREVEAMQVGKGRWWVLGLLFVSSPPAAWASSGMETGLVTLLGALALRPSRAAPLAAGVAAALRPEMIPWACVLAAGTQVASGPAADTRLAPWRALKGLAAVAVPVGVVLGLRGLFFGAPTPLSLIAKPPDLAYGVRYLLTSLLWAGPFWFLVTRSGWPALEGRYRAMAASVVVHAGAVCLAGGDWMPLFRLWVPIWPCLIVLGAALSRHASRKGNTARLVAAAVVSLSIGWVSALPGRNVLQTRAAWVAQLAPALTDEDIVGTLDAGWVGAAAPGVVVDFAGVTNPEVAHMAGPHHAKHLDRGYLNRRRINVLVLLLSDARGVRGRGIELVFERPVETRLVSQEGFHEFRAVQVISSEFAPQRYLVLRRDPAPLRGALGPS